MSGLDNYRKCMVVLVLSIALAVLGLLFVGLSLSSGWAVTGSESFSPATQRGIEFVDYSELSRSQQNEFDRMREGELITDDMELREDGVMGVSYRGDNYVVRDTIQSEVGHWGYFFLGIVSLVVGSVSSGYSWNRKISLRLDRLKEDPESYLESRDR